ncbi:hypothetical protein H112_01210 [Trichophyton rubrum D6]|uniref:Ataxin-2 C-terminal domain-containing protein n=4 Tax=Trichophyton TaxID=5550 RepID=A0A178F5Z8_TRIRU|nr:uncharacterized protein TERG_07624 [Trichophyton rubrum CBS 118892]EZF26663.1 hypothetical protein H100_01203 [Trichophyton rubrum MR850]EZF45769.1 hypothetical protein H102_01200 [Trichophyton rubrum CBS 100081]EZF56343.1 hypothetical protein H103_01207 [Trichophyton rubrum CBS 288.86]EZF66926.1 hypothetical protein H104_01193 [Trichophyton rubrum CBS 289.86]EZF77739.1 hypothetical protein H105_01213 [Trichophyton soudanense CBS 452.61]EZF88271.1 hypothetical protein H110_01210 [Trichophy
MAEASVTDDERANRMKALQMADLGTARREHISTVDRPNKLHRIGIQQIEAIRDSNRKGTEAYTLAETNREKLNSWATYHETLEENMDAENLDPLLDGQTHRLALEAKIKGTNLDHPASSSRGKRATRGALHSGRGGGAAGSRGRGGTSHQSNTRSGDITKSDPSRLSPTVFTPTKKALAPLPQKPLDPSKDCNNPPATRGRADRKRYGSSRNLPPVTKARRPVFAAPPNINFESLLADGDDFMAAVAGVQFATVAKPAQPPETPKVPEAPTKSQDVSPDPPMSQERSVPSDNFQKDVPEPPLQQPQSEVKAVVPSEPNAEAAAPATNLKPAAPLRIDVFTNPSEIRDGQGADTIPLKTDHGFGSYLPQPQRHSTDAENHDADDLFLCTSSEATAAAQIEEDKTEGVNISTSLLDISDGPEDTIPQTQPAPQSAPQRVEPKDESNATKEELAKLTKILSNQSLLDPEIVVYLQERRERLEKELVEKELARNPEVVKTAIHTAEPSNTKSIQFGASNLVASVATPNAPTTANLSDITNRNTGDVVNPNSSENIKNVPMPVEVKKPEIRNSSNNTFDHNIVYAIPGAFPSKPPTTSPHDVPLIIGDHLLPGRPMKKCETPRPSAPVYEPKLHHLPGTLSGNSNQPSTSNQAHQFHEPMMFTYHATSGGTSVATSTSFSYAPLGPSTTGSQPAIITHTAPVSFVSPTGSAVLNAPKSRFKMRDTPQFPISAATMQYYSGTFLEEQMKQPTTPIRKTNENINPAMGFASSQPIEPGQKSGDHSRNQSFSLSPVANTFRPVLQSRSPIPAAFGAPNSGRSATSHHSKFSSTASETPREPKSVFVAEMAKRGVSVSGAPVNNQPVERKKSGMESSKYAH